MEQKQPDQPQDEAAERRTRFDAFIEHLQRDPFEEIDEPGDQGLVVGGLQSDPPQPKT